MIGENQKDYISHMRKVAHDHLGASHVASQRNPFVREATLPWTVLRLRREESAWGVAKPKWSSGNE